MPVDWTRPADVKFLSECHPEANGRSPLRGEQIYTLRWRLEDGRVLDVAMGEMGYRDFCSMLRQMAVDDALDEALQAAREPMNLEGG